MRDELRRSFAEAAAAELPGLRRFAYAVSGDAHRADDLVQRALERVYVAWPRASRADDVGAYCRTVLSRLAIDDSRRSWFRRERTVQDVPSRESADLAAAAADRVDLAAALSDLTTKQRAIVVLRYLEDRPVSQVAAVLGISEGTVKRQSHDALAHLRQVLDEERSPR